MSMLTRSVSPYLVGPLLVLLSATCYSAEKWVNCIPADVMAFDASRIHIQCSNRPDGFPFFAVPVSKAEFANQVLSIATAAIAYQKTVNIYFNVDDNTTGPGFWCDPKDCRPIIAITLNR